MNTRFKTWLAGLAAALLIASPLSADDVAGATEGEAAKEINPVVVVSIAPLDELSEDVAYLASAAGMAPIGELFKEKLDEYSQGFDRSRPAGAFVLLEKIENPTVIGFLPVTDLRLFLGHFEDKIGQPIELEGGVLEIDTERPFYVKQADNWAFVARSAHELRTMPKIDPVATLGGLNQEYDLAVRFLSGNVSPEMRELAITQLRSQLLRRGLEQIEDAGQAEHKALEEVYNQALKAGVTVLDELNQLTFGLRIDRENKINYWEYTVTANEGTALADRLASFQQGTSEHTGFLQPDGALALNVHGMLTEEDSAKARKQLAKLRAKALEKVENSPRIPDEQTRADAKARLAAFLDRIQAGLQERRIDCGACLMLEGTSLTVLAGGWTPDGPALQQAIENLIDLAAQDPEFPEIHDAGEYRGVKFKTAKVAVPRDEADARELFGDHLNVTAGFGPQSAYVAVGKSGVEALKKVIDESIAGKSKTVPPAEISIGLSPIIKFIAQRNEDVNAMILANALQGKAGQDHLTLTVREIENGLAYRVEVEDGVIQAIGPMITIALMSAGAQ